jgi:hypothetical protein
VLRGCARVCANIEGVWVACACIQDKLEQDHKDTPLQEKLDDMANLIG